MEVSGDTRLATTTMHPDLQNLDLVFSGWEENDQNERHHPRLQTFDSPFQIPSSPKINLLSLLSINDEQFH
ncbi:hypothetical protein JHK82_050001 [Glycine max]|uniref:Uncharacterized protein n=1 Tax=Glycine soja TaxID=3848 RepID=A0A0B2R9U6_GLYSO|nr:hypothetical protein JHK86_049878 [Glycine max]KAG4924139.1 hypothetical protein JHK87_049679 [Glycine soja]KAG4935723.1 hypothetical protein JHK85_050642 [Glycine max]KAG5091223.1 hypothetical protein JHK82_050001 [Glycine max]KAG5094336.1 hypothetical protein JHK84_049924 [Glycine max]